MTPRKRAAADYADVEAQLRAIERGDDEGELDLGRGQRLHVSSLSKTFFPEAGITKGGLMRYYTRVAPWLLPQIEGRALVLKRYPNGVTGPMFFQQNAGDHVPDEVRVATLDTVELGAKPRIIGGDLLTLLYTVQLGAIEVHPWLSRVNDIDAPDRCLIDLDPGDDVPFSAVAALARDVVRIAEACGLTVALKTSGASGIHIVLPLAPRTRVRDVGRAGAPARGGGGLGESRRGDGGARSEGAAEEEHLRGRAAERAGQEHGGTVQRPSEGGGIRIGAAAAARAHEPPAHRRIHRTHDARARRAHGRSVGGRNRRASHRASDRASDGGAGGRIDGGAAATQHDSTHSSRRVTCWINSRTPGTHPLTGAHAPRCITGRCLAVDTWTSRWMRSTNPKVRPHAYAGG